MFWCGNCFFSVVRQLGVNQALSRAGSVFLSQIATRLLSVETASLLVGVTSGFPVASVKRNGSASARVEQALTATSLSFSIRFSRNQTPDSQLAAQKPATASDAGCSATGFGDVTNEFVVRFL